ncbi:prepilin-type N-terminal cleavage/methylation domain-containing protein [Niveispirillum sp. KHB5.9]|uniref:prepilin-type N-terminal cleavage/methylation domain-containing protein n=1 Tax=Niveispirillum sp. KHB5.9 TaxID=3400269 RepID=UPI003A849C43
MRSGERGLTLVEALVALALLGLLAAGAAGLLPVMGRLSAGAAAAQAETQALARSHDFLRAVIAQARPLTDLGKTAPVEPLRMEPDHLRLLTRLPDGLGPGGPVLVDLAVERAETTARATLRLTVTPLRPGGQAAQAALIEGVGRIGWDYYDAATGSWMPDWTGRPGLPSLLRLRVTGTGMGEWPDLVVRPLLEQGPLCVYDTVGGQCRQEI